MIDKTVVDMQCQQDEIMSRLLISLEKNICFVVTKTKAGC
ncbi:hypothetical protein JBW_03451 [Pelosinus fermentans JBW45]|uniref:Uncharacterized protein n=1 Tax=Pelosinus fermentans JBW45 TaxID=1192197 RepID=I9NSS9_9FIRM|nr:hypothetical protein JBW_03451 [Pelosinus fermentans JBW45]